MRSISVSLLVAGFVAAGISACTAEHVSAIDETSQGVQGEQKQADPSDPYGSCELVSTDEYDDFQCSLDGRRCDGASSVGLSSDGHSWAGEFWNECMHECEQDADCPVPNTGDAVPRCRLINLCELPCDETTTCPDGFTCAWDGNLIDTNEDGSLTENARFTCVQHVIVDPFRPSADF